MLEKNNEWNISYIKDIDDIKEIKEYLEDIGKQLKDITNSKLGYEIVVSSNPDLDIIYEFNILYRYKKYDIGIPYKLFDINYTSSKFKYKLNFNLLYVDNVAEFSNNMFETFQELKTYIDNMKSSEIMGRTLERIVKLTEIQI